jgi:hypothetical protein
MLKSVYKPIRAKTCLTSSTIAYFFVRVSNGEPLNVPITWVDVLDLWKNKDCSFYQAFLEALSDTRLSEEHSSGFPDFFWECRPVSKQTLSDRFEFALTDARGHLRAKQASINDFEEHFEGFPKQKIPDQVTSFWNLGGDAKLVVPAPSSSRAADSSTYAHLTTHHVTPESSFCLYES